MIWALQNTIACGVVHIVLCCVIGYVVVKLVTAFFDWNLKKRAAAPPQKLTLEEEFTKFCFDMAKSTNDKDKTIKEECWKYLKVKGNYDKVTEKSNTNGKEGSR